MKPSQKFVEEIIPILKEDNFDFQIPIENNDGNYRNILEKKLNDYLNFYNKKIHPLTKGKSMNFYGVNSSEIPEKIIFLNKQLLKTFDNFSNGKTFLANKTFNETLDEIKYSKLQNERTSTKRIFYRARPKSDKQYTKSELFHIPFEKRYLVSTNRYSIPGIPALYLGENSYTCWEEFDRKEIEEIFFSVYENIDNLNIIEILRIEDLLKDIENGDIPVPFIPYSILQYFTCFPLSIACSIKVHNKNGNFKPEYIIPQMLLEYTTQDDEIDGIKFPSTKVNYSKLKYIQAYNYVFPIRESKESGFCPVLKNKFKLSHPTSLELENLLDNPYIRENQMSNGIEINEKSAKISIIENDERYYYNTSFGKIDKKFEIKTREKL
ncbi:hypothetical protein PG913_08080 [Tenacibaculum pacificus]|uniref:hypothetical protein n=1 Tax=Tenacibaculum pacificus TaxID=3018314 RepID=UPI0022F3CFC1|nr:hypothetical protein [Tenacibaculum pacificus]WBX72862.1 hypothetical protein PG913_08080 [Tenacibaculum pacificus]